jgi:hypothetical protein
MLEGVHRLECDGGLVVRRLGPQRLTVPECGIHGGGVPGLLGVIVCRRLGVLSHGVLRRLARQHAIPARLVGLTGGDVWLREPRVALPGGALRPALRTLRGAIVCGRLRVLIAVFGSGAQQPGEHATASPVLLRHDRLPALSGAV